MDYFTELGYVGLFVSAFLAATIIPLSSEIVLSTLLLNGLSRLALVGGSTCKLRHWTRAAGDQLKQVACGHVLCKGKKKGRSERFKYLLRR